MAATHYGTLNNYRPDQESIKTYLDQVDLYFTANTVPDDKQVPILLSSIGATTYSLLCDLLAPEAPKSKTKGEIFAALRKHYEPTRAVIAERFHFQKRDQVPDESLAEYDAALRKLATHCNFGAYLTEALRDRFVAGLRSEAMQRRLLAETELTLKRAMEIAQGMEAAESNTRALKASNPSIKSIQSKRRPQPNQPCYRCGKSNHSAADCRFKDAECHSCGKQGHIAPACRSNPPSQFKKTEKRRFKTHLVEPDGNSSTDSEADTYHLYRLTEPSTQPITVTVKIEDTPLKMEIDTGAAISIISEATRKAKFSKLKLRKSNILLKTYTDEAMMVTGQINVCVNYGEQVARLVLVVVAGSGPSLFGRNWLKYLQLDWKCIATVKSPPAGTLKNLLHEYDSLFKDELGTVTSHKATLRVRPDATPRFFKPRPVPYATKEAIGDELDRMEQQGIIQKIPSSDWAAPLVAVPKKDGRFRLCGDYKVTINQDLEVDQYPLPKPEDLFATLANGSLFTKLDLSQAYLQVELDKDSTKYVTINTHQGLYQFSRLPFGVASAPAIFQRLMDTILRGVPHVICYLDDLLITGVDEEDHLHNLEQVLKLFTEHGLRLKKEKCIFLAKSVEYLGHQISKEGIQALPSKVDAIAQAPEPKNVQELRSFLGLLNYYGKFIKNLSSILYPINQLLQASHKWEWTQECQEAFTEAKKQLTSSDVLTHYDPDLPINMAADASAYGIGAVISHVLPDGAERPICFASRTLTTSEQNYAQLEKEALALVFGTKKFHQYLYGRKFTLITDHKPLTAIFGPKKGIPSLAAARLQRWAIFLSGYDYNIQFKPTQAHSNADALSRLPLPVQDSYETADINAIHTFNVAQIEALPVTSQQVQTATRRDPTLSKVLKYVKSGWPQKVTPDLQPYFNRRLEIGIESGCLMWGIRTIIPQNLHAKTLRALHENHPGMSRMKAIARSYVWWSGLDKDIENQAKACLSCQEQASKPAVAPLHPWVWPNSPWKRIHIDYAGPFLNKMFLVVVDAHSKWPEVIQMSSTIRLKTRSRHCKHYLLGMDYQNRLFPTMVHNSHPKNLAILFKPMA